jgi:hypothetical protein
LRLEAAQAVRPPSNPLAVTAKAQVFFGNPAMAQSEVIVDWSGLVPRLIGVYQLKLRVPGVGGVNSPTGAPVSPVVAVNRGPDVRAKAMGRFPPAIPLTALPYVTM